MRFINPLWPKADHSEQPQALTVFGKPGSGKTVAAIIPLVLSETACSKIVWDVREELLDDPEDAGADQ